MSSIHEIYKIFSGDNAKAGSLIVTLQVLRFVASAMVLYGHIQHEVIVYMVDVWPGFRPFQPFDWGMGVDIFFVISGVVMALTVSKNVGIDYMRFMRGRLQRIVPMYWLFTTLTLAASFFIADSVTNVPTDWPYIVASYLFIPWPRADGDIYPVLSLGWTLNLEMFFYFLIVISLILWRKHSLVLTAMVLAGLVSIRILIPEDAVSLRFLTQPIILEFGAGMLLAALYPRLRKVHAVFAWSLVVLGFAWAGVGYRLEFPDDLARVSTQGVGAVLVCCGALCLEGKIARGRAMELMLLLGGASYALYLSHPFTIRFSRIAFEHIPQVGPYFYILLTSILSLVVSVGVYLIIERPLAAWFKRRSLRHVDA